MKQNLSSALTDLNQYFKNIYNVKHENGELRIDKKMLHNALEFKTIKIRECMIPRNEITAIDIMQADWQNCSKLLWKRGHSKIIIYRNSLDDIIGYCHSSSLFKMPTKLKIFLRLLLQFLKLH